MRRLLSAYACSSRVVEWRCAGTYALYLPILAGMSGGGVYTNDTHLFATNDFSVTTSGCSSGNCYNGGTSERRLIIVGSCQRYNERCLVQRS